MYQFIFNNAVFFWLITAICLLSTVNSAIYYTYFWQLKEYRWDRMRDFLKTKSGNEKIFTLSFVLKSLALLGFIYAVIDPRIIVRIRGEYIWVGMCLVALIDCLSLGFRIIRKKVYRPVWTGKALIILVGTVALSVLMGPVLTRSFNPWVWQGWIYFAPIISAASAVLSPFVNALLIAVFYPLTQFSKGRKLAQANRKIAQMQGLKVIGITGSYGKSSVKEFLSQMLEKKFNVLKTPGNTNTEIGVAEVVLKSLKPEHQVFIVEAGAYKIGEIKKIADMVKPRIGIITAVKDAHLGLFGSLENIKKAKFELIESLPEFGVAIFNNDNEGAADLATRSEKLKLAKRLKYSAKTKADLTASNLAATPEGIKFEVNGVKFSTPLPGIQNISNVLAAMAAALELGFKLEELVEVVATLKMREHTMSVKKVSENLVLVDDTYNANPDGVIAGLEYINLYKDWQKIVIFPGMLELGDRSVEEHKRVAAKMSEMCDFVALSSKDFSEIMLRIFEEKSFKNFEIFVENQMGMLDILKAKITGKKSVLLFVSRGSELVFKKLSQ